MSNVVLDALWTFLGMVYDATIGKLMEFFVDILETVLFWAVPGLPPQDIQNDWAVIVCILALCAILYAALYIVFKGSDEVEYNYRYMFLGILFMRSGLQIFHDSFVVGAAAVTTMLSTFDNPVSMFFHLLAGGAIALLVSALPIVLWIIGAAIQTFIALIGGFLLTIAGVFYLIPLIPFKERGDRIVKILIGDIGIAVANAGLLMLTLFASSGAGLNIISRFLIGLGYIVVTVVVMYFIMAWAMDNSGYEKNEVLFLRPDMGKMKSVLDKAKKKWKR